MNRLVSIIVLAGAVGCGGAVSGPVDPDNSTPTGSDPAPGSDPGPTTGNDPDPTSDGDADPMHETDSDPTSPGDSDGSGGADTPEKPGPSAHLFNNPYYACVRNFYVSTTGSDANDGTTLAKAWKTIAKADQSARQGGDCINVAAGTYDDFNDALQYGGSTASSTGYVTYRCSAPSFISGTGCVVTANGGAQAGHFRGEAYPNYLIFDGFNMLTNNSTVQDDVAFSCAGPGTFGGTTQTSSLGCHHWWIINNVISGHGQAGININDTEYLYSVHNTVTQNSHMGCVGYYGSGIAYVVAKPVTGYTKTADDTNAHSNAALSAMGVQGPDFPFTQVVAWNVVGNNYQGCATGSNTDGNGIIIDTFNITSCNSNSVDFPNKTLVGFNVVYNNGGGGIHVFASTNVTVANNSVYFNFTDPTQSPWERPGIDVNCGSGTGGFGAGSNLFVNNIAYARPNGATCDTDEYTGAQIPFSIGGDNTHSNGVYNSPGGNVSFSVGTPCHTTDASGNAIFGVDPAWSCTTNACNSDPKWVNVGLTSVGSESVAPSGTNFALQASSPAIGAGHLASYLPASAVDAGACSSTFTQCP